MRLCLLAIICAAPVQTFAAEIQRVSVNYKDGQFYMAMDVLLDTTPERAFTVMTNYTALGKINDAVEQSQLLKTFSTLKHRVKTITVVCVLWICEKITQVQDMVKNPQTLQLHAELTADSPDFESGHAEWHFSAHPKGTRMIFNSVIEPSFWIPPLIGTWAVSRMLTAHAKITSSGLEREAGKLP